MSIFFQFIWEFIREDMSNRDFEQWVYKTPELEDLLGGQLYFELITCNFRDPNKVWELKSALKNKVDLLQPRVCECLAFKAHQKVPISSEDSKWETISEGFAVLKWRTPWLILSCCKHCGQFWYVAVDSGEGDYYLYRLQVEEVEDTKNNIWPTVFDEFEVVWPDDEWLQVNGYESLADWQEKNNKSDA